MSFGRLARLIRMLPRESATSQSAHGPSVDWSTTDHLLAAAVDALRAANWQRAGDKTKKRPDPITRPGTDDGRRRSTLTGREIAGRLVAQQKREVLRGS